MVRTSRLFSLFSFSYFPPLCSVFFFFNDTATTEIYTLSLHDALPIYRLATGTTFYAALDAPFLPPEIAAVVSSITGLDNFRRQERGVRSEEHTSELQSLTNLVCRLLLEKKKKASVSPASV